MNRVQIVSLMAATAGGITLLFGLMDLHTVSRAAFILMLLILTAGLLGGKHQMSQRVCYLLTSQQRFLDEHSNGSCNGNSPGVTGRKVSAILQAKTDSSSESASQELTQQELPATESPWPFPSDATLVNQTNPRENGTSGEIATSTAKSWAQIDPLSWWKILYPPTKQVKQPLLFPCLEFRYILPYYII